MRSKWLLVLIASSLVLSGSLYSSPALAHTPDSALVKGMVNKAMDFLEDDANAFKLPNSLGGKALMGLAALKSDRNNSKLIAEGVKKCREAAAGKDAGASDHQYNYSLGLAIIFLCELDAEQYQSEITSLMGMMRQRQRPDGAWSYPNHATGDTSQSQYGVLSSWIAHKSGVPASRQSIEAACNWLIRTQDPSGAFPYQGHDPGSYNRVRQPELRFTMAPAAMGSLYICADLLGVKVAEKQQDSDIPAEFRKKQETSSGGGGGTVDVNMLKRAINDGNRWYSSAFKIAVEKNQYYYLYSLERYASFREIAEGKTEKEPAWYNQGVDYLAKSQTGTGAWDGNRGPYISSAFAVMFLVRSTQKSIEKLQDGLLVGGQGLPKDLKNLKLRDDGQIVGENEKTSFDDLLKLMQSDELSNISTDVNLDLARDNKERASQLDKLKQLVQGESYQARLLAVRTLARTGDLDNVPVLIYALSDPDERVTREARDGLRFISRKFDGFGLPDRASDQQKEKAQDDWARWYRSIRPHAEFEYR